MFAPFSEFESKLKSLLGGTIHYIKTPSGKVLGFVNGGRIFLNPNTLNPTTVFCEITHISQDIIRDLAKQGDAQAILRRFERII